MAARRRRRGTDSRYTLRFGTTALLLLSGTLVLVLFVLPQRYVLSAGFRESGASFPTPAVPFVPADVVAVAARPVPQPPQPIPPGPAELFWDEVIPLLEAERYSEAIPVFERYLADFPADQDARREYATALLAADDPAAAVPVLRDVVATNDDFQLRLLLARTLREMGRTDEAAAEYAALSAQRPDDDQLALEWGQALAWAERYEDAAAVLSAALARSPDAVALRVELARTYYALGRLEAAAALLADVDDAALAGVEGLALRDDVRAALVVPPPPEPPPEPPPTLLERAVTARVNGDLDAARALFEEAVAESPASPGVWQAYADFLEYELGDLDGARDALLEVERLTEMDPGLQYRLAQLEIWTDRTDEATNRLLALLAYLDSADVAEAPAPDAEAVNASDVQALLGDLYRWDGDRIESARRYGLALMNEPGHPRATDGLAALRAEIDRQIVELESPGVGGTAYSLADTDDFLRVDLAGTWSDVGEDWVWGGRVGNRWLSGLRLDGAKADDQGVFVELETARWWRWGTIRTGFQFGAERVRSAWDYSLGASLRHRPSATRGTEVRYLHGPAYPLANTLQSVLAEVVQDRLTLTHGRALDSRWTLTGVLDGAWLRADEDRIGAAQEGRSVRLQADLAVGRTVTRGLTLGLAARTLTYTRAAPVTAGRPLFWDPVGVVSAGPYLQLNRELTAAWLLTGRVAPGLALIDERRVDGTDTVPHVSAEVGIRREGSRFWTAFDLFYYQGQFDGYRTYGARLTFSARDFSSLAGSR